MENVYFFILLLLSMLIFYTSDKKNNKKLLIMGILIISIISGFRGISVGIDTASYYKAFINHFPNKWQFEETGFRFVTNLLMNLLKKPNYVVFIYSFVTNLLIFLRLWDFRKDCNFSFMSLLYLLIYFIDSMNIMRQFVALSIIFYSTRFLEKKEYLLFLIMVILSTTIHKTTILALLLIVVYMWNNASSRNKFLMTIPLIIISTFAINFALVYESDHINNYFSAQNMISNVNLTYIYRLIVFFSSFLLFLSNKKIVFKNEIKSEEKEIINNNVNEDFWIFTTLYFCGLFLSSMGMFFNFMQRVGYIYLIFELLYWGYLVKNSKNKKLNVFLILVYAIYVFSLEILRNGSGIFPFFFNF